MAILEAVFADKPGQTPQEVERRRRMAQELLKKGTEGQSPRSPLELAGRLAMTLTGQYQAGKAEREDASNRTAANKALIDAVYGGSSDAAPSFNSQVAATSPSAAAPSSGGNSSYRDAIASIESKGSGDYGAVGPTNPKMGRALGRYQIMEANIGPWSREALGREVSAEEFMKNPQIQDAIFDHRFGQYVNKYGPEGAAQAWFAGPGGVGKTDRKDVLGTSVGEYGSKFVNALGPQAKPVEVASLGGASIDAPMAYYDDKGFRVENRPPVIQPDPLARPAGASSATVEANAPQTAAQAVNAMASPRTVGALPVPPNAQPMPQGIPAEFAGSQQLANAQGGIVPALMGGTAASPEQIAQARALGAAQPQPQPQGQDNRALIATLLGNPYTAEAGQQLLMQEMQRRQEANDPLTQLKIQQAQREAAGEWQKLSDNRLFNPVTGETRDIPLGPNAAPSDLGLNPQYGVDSQGNPVLIQIGKDGKAVQTKLPEGVALSKEPVRLDAGTHFVLLDPITRQPVGQIPKNLAEAESQKAQGKAQGEAAASLPSDMQQAGQTISQIDELIKHPGLSSIVGPLDQFRGTVTLGGEGRDALTRLKQLQGGAFLQAYGMLKGGGQITEIEGSKAEAAMARMERALDEKDFKAALKDFRDAVSTGMDKLRQKAGQSGAATPAPAAEGGERKRLKFNPATGELE